MACNCPGDNRTNFCGKGIVKHSMCFLPAIYDNGHGTTVVITQPNLAAGEVIVEYVDCGLIIVCGKYTKTVTNSVLNVTFVEQIPFQFSIEDPNIENLNAANYSVTAVEVKEACSDFTCAVNPATDPFSYYKLNEKDIVSVRVVYTAP